jgi:hypothetical protein
MEFAIWHLWDNRKEPPGPSARKSCCLRFQDTLSKKACWWHKQGRPDIKHSMGKWTKRIHMLPCNDYNKIQLTIFETLNARVTFVGIFIFIQLLGFIFHHGLSYAFIAFNQDLASPSFTPQAMGMIRYENTSVPKHPYWLCANLWIDISFGFLDGAGANV